MKYNLGTFRLYNEKRRKEKKKKEKIFVDRESNPGQLLE